MPRRKAENGLEESSARKKPLIVSANEINGLKVRFEFEESVGKWTAFNDPNNNTMISAYNSFQPSNTKKQVVLDKEGDITLLIRFDKMVQKNKKTGWENRVRCSVLDDDGDYYIWQWQDSRTNWQPYDLTNTCILEKEKQKGSSNVSLTVGKKDVTVDLTTLEQVEDNTEARSKITRLKTDASEEPLPKKSVKQESGRVRNGKSGVKVEAMDNGEAVKSGARKSGTKMSKREMEREGKDIVKTVVLSGKAPVDPECIMSGKARVFCEGDDVWDCMLNQTNISNNNNKYYLIQLLQEDKSKSFYVWQRWGRVGYSGQNNLVPCGPDLNKAKDIFSKKFQDKTKNSWDLRDCFEKVPGKYDMIKMDYSAKGSDNGGGDTIKKEPSEQCPDSTIDHRLQDFIKLICDVKSMEEAVVEMKYDAKKAPLGKLTKEQIKAGYTALKKIDVCIQSGDFGRSLEQACSEFYTRIPHDFGMRQPPLIRSKEVLKEKIQLLEALDDIEIALRTLETGDMSINPVDRHYQSLHCDLKPLDKGTEDFKLIQDYVKNTHAKTHRQYKMKVHDVFECKRDKEEESFKDYGNRMLLWHGSRLSNWVGILSQGLRIAPPEAPVTGYMFGKGVYFADMSSKSANYCFASPGKNIGILLLCEVSLGKCNELLSADYNAHKLPKGTHSVKGMGSIAPDPSGCKSMSDGVVVPMGKGKDTNVKNSQGYTLNYNEYIVYNTNQIKMRYLVKTEFDFS